MKIATNQPFKFALSRYKTEFVFLDSPDAREAEGIVLLCADIFGDSGITEIKRLTFLLKSFSPDVPCFLFGVKTRVPNRNFSWYRSPERDEAIRRLIDEILKRSKSIGVKDELTQEWMIEFFGYSRDQVDIVHSEDMDSAKHLISIFVEKNNIKIPIDFSDIYYFHYKRGVPQRTLFYSDYKKEIVISAPKVELKDDGNVRYCADIDINGQSQILWLDTSKEYGKYLLLDRCDAFLIGVLPFALRYNHDIVCKAPVTEQLLHNIREILIPSLVKNDKRLYEIEIIADIDSVYVGGEAVGAAMSAGVDSFYTLWQYLNNPQYPSMKISHLYVGNYLYGGEAKERINMRAERVAAEIGLPLVKTDTNISTVFEKYINHLFYYAFKTFFGVLSLRKLWKVYFYSSAYDFSHFTLMDNATHDTAYMDLLLCDVLTTFGFRVFCAGVNADRLDKTRSLTEFPITYKYLNVCLDPKLEKNCSKCGKCIRTMLNIDMCGAIDLYRDVFDVDYYKQNKVKAFELMVKEKSDSFMRQAYEYFSDTEAELVKQAEKNVKIQ